MRKSKNEELSPVAVMDPPGPLTPAPTPEPAADFNPDEIAAEIAAVPPSPGEIESRRECIQWQANAIETGTSPMLDDADARDFGARRKRADEIRESGLASLPTPDAPARRAAILALKRHHRTIEGFLAGTLERWRELRGYHAVSALGSGEYQELRALDNARARAAELRSNIWRLQNELAQLGPTAITDRVAELREVLGEELPTQSRARAEMLQARAKWSTELETLEKRLATETWAELEGFKDGR